MANVALDEQTNALEEQVTHDAHINQLWRIKTVIAHTGLSQSEIYRLAALGQFPKPIRYAGTKSGWISSEIQEWVNNIISGARRSA